MAIAGDYRVQPRRLEVRCKAGTYLITRTWRFGSSAQRAARSCHDGIKFRERLSVDTSAEIRSTRARYGGN